MTKWSAQKQALRKTTNTHINKTQHTYTIVTLFLCSFFILFVFIEMISPRRDELWYGHSVIRGLN